MTSVTTENYRVCIIARVAAAKPPRAEVLFDKPINGYTLVHVGTDLADAERQSLPLLAEVWREKSRNR